MPGEGGTIDELQIEITSDSTEAVRGLDALSSALRKIDRVANSDGLSSLISKLRKISNIDFSNLKALENLPNKIKTPNISSDSQTSQISGASTPTTFNPFSSNTSSSFSTTNSETENTASYINSSATNAMANMASKTEEAAGAAKNISENIEEAATKGGALESILGLISKKIISSGGSTSELASGLSKAAGAASKANVWIAAATVAIKAYVTYLKVYYGILFKILSATAKIGKAIVTNIKDKINSLFEPIKNLIHQVARVAMYRMIRAAIKQITNSFTEGLEHVVQGVGSANKVMSLYSTQLMYMKNSIGAAIIPLLQMLYPLFEVVTNAVVKASNAINQFLSLLAGKSTYIKAKKQYVDYADTISGASQKAKKSVQNLTASFDELNDITQSASSSSNNDTDYTAYFTTAGIESNISDFFKKIKEQFKSGDMSGIGEDLGNKINAEIAKIDGIINWNNIGDKVTTAINSITSLLSSLLLTINWYDLGETVGDGVTTIFNALLHLEQSIPWTEIGASLAGLLNGLVETIPWEGIGEFFANEFVSIFKIIDGFLNGDPSQEREGFSFIELANGIVAGIESGLETISENAELIGNTITDLLVTAFQFGATLFGNSDLWENLATAINNIIDNMDVQKVADNMSDFLADAINGFATFVNTVDWDDVSDAIATIIGGLHTDEVTKAFKNLFYSAIKAGLTIAVHLLQDWALKKISKIVSWANISTKVSTEISSDSNSSYATGGFPEDGMFYANHSELVGQFSNGKTAVANNEQITGGIASAVEPAVYNAVRQALADSGNNSHSGSSNTDVYIDSKKVGRAITKEVVGEINRAKYKIITV